jgi:predicted nucleotidyltransferase
MSAPHTNRAALEAICRRFQLHILYAFGSRGREALAWVDGDSGGLAPGPSDLDIGVKPAEPLDVRRKVELAIALEDLFDVNRVDLVVLPEADPFLAVNVIRGERLFADDSYLADEYDLYVLRRAADLLPFERERQRRILEGER